MTQFDVQLNLDAQVDLFKTSFDIDIAYPNTDYSPTAGKEYIAVSYINGDVFQIAPIEGSENRTTMILQFDIYINADIGKYRFKEIVDAMQPYFRRGMVIHNNEIYTRVTNFAIIDLSQDADRAIQIVRVSTRSDYSNTTT